MGRAFGPGARTQVPEVVTEVLALSAG